MGKVAKPKEVVKHATMELGVSQELKRGTNIREIDVPPELEITHPTGIDLLDTAFGGYGVTPSSSILLSGGSGCGKTTLALQWCNAWTRLGHIALYNTNEEAAVQVAKTCKRLGLSDGFIIGQDRLVPKAIEHAQFLKKKYPGKRLLIVLDSLQTMDDGYYSNGGTNSNTQIRVTAQMVKYCKDTFDIGLLIGQVTKDGTFAGKNQVKHAVDIHIHAYFDKAKKSPTFGERIMETEKNRYGISGTQSVFGIDGKTGVFAKPDVPTLDEEDPDEDEAA